MKDASSEMRENVAKLTSSLATMQAQTSEFKGILDQMPQRFDRIDTFLEETKKNLGGKTETASEPTKEVPPKFAETFLHVGSPYMNLLVYAMALAYKTKKTLSIKEFSENVARSDISGYCRGVIVTMEATNLSEAEEADESGGGIFLITTLNSTLASDAGSYFKGYLAKEFIDKPKSRQAWESRINKVEAMFLDTHEADTTAEEN